MGATRGFLLFLSGCLAGGSLAAFAAPPGEFVREPQPPRGLEAIEVLAPASGKVQGPGEAKATARPPTRGPGGLVPRPDLQQGTSARLREHVPGGRFEPEAPAKPKP